MWPKCSPIPTLQGWLQIPLHLLLASLAASGPFGCGKDALSPDARLEHGHMPCQACVVCVILGRVFE